MKTSARHGPHGAVLENCLEMKIWKLENYWKLESRRKMDVWNRMGGDGVGLQTTQLYQSQSLLNHLNWCVALQKMPPGCDLHVSVQNISQEGCCNTTLNLHPTQPNYLWSDLIWLLKMQYNSELTPNTTYYNSAWLTTQPHTARLTLEPRMADWLAWQITWTFDLNLGKAVNRRKSRVPVMTLNLEWMNYQRTNWSNDDSARRKKHLVPECIDESAAWIQLNQLLQ